jgi:hypothetical protein
MRINVQLYDNNDYSRRAFNPASGPRLVAPVTEGSLPIAFRSSLNFQKLITSKAVGGKTHGLFS